MSYYFAEVFRHQNIFLSLLLVCVVVSCCVRIAWISTAVPAVSWKSFIVQNNAIVRTRYVYIFNWTNPENVFTKNDTPSVNEIGPFVFEELWNITDTRWFGDKASYKRRREWRFLKKLSPDLEMNITTVNVVFAKYLKLLRNEASVTVQRAYDYLIQKHAEQMVLTKTAREWLFDGYTYSLFNGTRFQLTPEEQQFGWFLNSNGSVDDISYDSSEGVFEINSKYSFHTHGKNLLNYEAIWNRVIQLNRSDETTYLGQKYIGSDDSVSHCVHGIDDCITETYPLTMSLPHFLNRQHSPKIDGIRPNVEHHRPVAVHDEYFGNDLESNLTYQLNVKLNPVNWSNTILKHLPETELPMIWYKDVTDFPTISKQTSETHARNRTIKTTLNIMIAVFSVTLGAIILLILFKNGKLTYRLLS